MLIERVEEVLRFYLVCAENCRLLSNCTKGCDEQNGKSCLQVNLADEANFTAGAKHVNGES